MNKTANFWCFNIQSAALSSFQLTVFMVNTQQVQANFTSYVVLMSLKFVCLFVLANANIHLWKSLNIWRVIGGCFYGLHLTVCYIWCLSFRCICWQVVGKCLLLMITLVIDSFSLLHGNQWVLETSFQNCSNWGLCIIIAVSFLFLRNVAVELLKFPSCFRATDQMPLRVLVIYRKYGWW